MRYRFAALAAALAFVGCTDTTPLVEPDVRPLFGRGGIAGPCSGLPSNTRSITVLPATATLQVGNTVELIIQNQSQVAVPDCALSWSSSLSNVATVNNVGTVTGLAAGQTTVTIRTQGKVNYSTQAVITVTQPDGPPPPGPAPIATLAVVPGGDTLSVGETASLIAVAKDSAGNVLTGRVVAWTSSNAGVATVSGAGLVTGVSAGSAVVTATSEGKSATAGIVVTVPTSAGGLANECQRPQAGWIFCDDFDIDRLSQYFEVDYAGGRFGRVAGAGAENSFGMRGVYTTAAQTTSGNLKIAFGRTPSSYIRPIDAGTARYRDVYWRVYVRNQPGWIGGGGDKLSRATSLVTSNWAQAMAAHVWSGGSNQAYLMLDPASGTDVNGVLRTTRYNDFGNMRWLGMLTGTTPLFGSAAIGQWHCVEAHARLNDAGLTNGVFEFWVNDQLNARTTTLNWVGSYADYGINAVFVENYWNNGSPVQQYRDLDNFVVSTQRIGCNTTLEPPPPPPTGPATIATLTVSPARDTLVVGETVGLIAIAKDSVGNTLTGRAVTWSTSAPAVASVSGLGVVTALGAGTATITAASEGKAATAVILVTAPPPPTDTSGFVSNLPLDKGLQLIVDTKFGEANVSQNKYGADGLFWENDAPNRGSFGRNILVPDAPYGPDVFEQVYPGNDAGNGYGGARIFGPNCDGRAGECYRQGKRWTRVYMSMMVWVSPNYSMHTNPGTEKWMYNWTTDGTNRLALVIQWGALNAGANGPTFGLYFYPQAPSLEVTPQTGSGRVVKGQWNRLEVYIQLNSPNTANGEYRAWINGQLVHSVSNFLYRNGSSQWYIDGILLEGIRGGGASAVLTPPEGQVRRYSRMAFYGF